MRIFRASILSSITATLTFVALTAPFFNPALRAEKDLSEKPSSEVAAPVKQETRIVKTAFSRGEAIARTALSYRGTPYRRGASGRGAFDCSGFTSYLFARAGTTLPRTAAGQYHRGAAVPKDDLTAGDLVFFRNTYKRGVSHVGIYIGNNNFVHAASTGRGVRVDTLDRAYYINHWAGARRPK